MSKEIILDKAIAKAIKNGYKDKHSIVFYKVIKNNEYFVIIFSHEFASCFWGRKLRCNICGKRERSCYCNNTDNFVEDWKYHIQKTALSIVPIKYLEQFL